MLLAAAFACRFFIQFAEKYKARLVGGWRKKIETRARWFIAIGNFTLCVSITDKLLLHEPHAIAM
jgi:hypothetical protein